MGLRRGTSSLWVVLLSLWLAAGALADQPELDAELQKYIAVFEGDAFGPKKQALGELAWAGISDPRAYDPMEADLLAGYQIPDSDKARVEEMSWLAKGVALSGDSKYQASLEKVLAGTPSKKLKKHVTTALQRLPDYQTWNPIISDGLAQAPAGRLNQTRVLNMLASDVPELIRYGAKATRNKYPGDEQLLKAVNDSLLTNYNRNLSNKVQIDAVNHLIRTLGESGDSAWRPTLEQAAGSSNKKIQKYARKYAALL